MFRNFAEVFSCLSNTSESGKACKKPLKLASLDRPFWEGSTHNPWQPPCCFLGQRKRDSLREEMGDAVDPMAGIKADFDPTGILNPGKVFN
jgi:hypothetical protein